MLRCSWMDDVMVDARAYGIKLLISIYSNNALSRDGGDAYSNAFGGVTGFYEQQDAQDAFDARIRHVLDHTHVRVLPSVCSLPGR